MKTQKELKEDAYAEMADAIHEYRRTHKGQISRALMQDLYMIVVKSMFKALFELGKYQFPAGLGAFRLKRMPVTRRRSPVTGNLFSVHRERSRVFYIMGTALLKVLGYENDYKYTPKADYQDGLAGLIPPVAEPDPKPGV